MRRRMIFIGIDPGKTGGIAAICGHGKIRTWVTPIIPGKTKKILGGLKTEKVSKDQYDIKGMIGVLKPYELREDVRVFIEQQHNLPPYISASAYSEFVLGFGYGLWLGILESLGFDYRTVRARDWHSLMFAGLSDVTDTKKASVEAAKKVFPGHEFLKSPRSRKPWHGLTDAALVAEYGRRVYESRVGNDG